MPTYKNTTGANIALDGFTVAKGATYETTRWITDLPAGVVKISDAPMYNPIVFSDRVTANTTITVPVTVSGDIKITLFVEQGEINVLLSSSANTPALRLNAGQAWERQVRGRLINDIRISFVSLGICWLLIETI